MTETRTNTYRYLDLFLNDVPLLDIRAPVEFKSGAFSNAINLPLMNDNERSQVGVCYKEKGPNEAYLLGLDLVKGDKKSKIIGIWQELIKRSPDGYLYCFRGGLRSEVAQRWLHESGTPYPCVEGGYKAMRRFLIDQLEESAAQSNFIILGGRTGCGKTEIIKRSSAVDLEGLAHHRGSSFGRRIKEQPTQINFENALSVALLKQRHRDSGPILLEDENRTIGQSTLPQSLNHRMSQAPLVIVEEPFEVRVERVLKEYVIDSLNDHVHAYGDAGMSRFSDYLLNSLKRIIRRLGLEYYIQLRDQMTEALRLHKQTGDLEGHREWITGLLHKYYDPMSDHQLQKKQNRLFFTGSQNEVLNWFLNLGARKK